MSTSMAHRFYGYDCGTMEGSPETNGVPRGPAWMVNTNNTLKDWTVWEDHWCELNSIAPEDKAAAIEALGVKVDWYGSEAARRLRIVAKASEVMVSAVTPGYVMEGAVAMTTVPDNETVAGWENMMYGFVQDMDLPILAGPAWFVAAAVQL